MGKNQKNYDYSRHGTYQLPRIITEENRRFLKSKSRKPLVCGNLSSYQCFSKYSFDRSRHDDCCLPASARRIGRYSRGYTREEHR